MKRIVIVLALVGLSVFQMKAQTQVKILTFAEAVKIALQNSVILNQQKNNLEYSQMQKLQSVAAIAPSLTGNASASQFNGNSFNQNTGSVTNGVRDNVQGSLQANLNIFSGFNRHNQVKQFTNALDAQAYNVTRTTQDVINTVAAQYLIVMQDIELLKIAKQNYEALNKQLEQVKVQVEVGSRSQVDEYNQDALTKGAELRMVQAEILLNNDKTTLTQTLLIDPSEDYTVEKPVWDLTKMGYDSLDIEMLMVRAKENRGDYLRAVKTEAASRYGAAAAKGFMSPYIYAFGAIGSAYNFQHDVSATVQETSSTPIVIFDPGAPTGYGVGYTETTKEVPNRQLPRSFNDQFQSDNVYKQYGFQLTVPLFNGLQNRAAYKQQKVLYENNVWTRKNLEYLIKNDVMRTVRNFEGAKKAYVISLDQQKAAQAALELETERYNLGITNFVDFTNANRVYIQAETDKAQAEYRLVFQRIAIEYAIGTLKEEDIAEQ
ncbi:hypothetical protein BH09BAC3_BH09BAC3_08170 [soil metagenome]